MKKYILLLCLTSIFFTSCSSVKVIQNGNTFITTKKKPIKYPIKTDNYFISGDLINPPVWKTKSGKFFYYKDATWPFQQKRVKLKIKK